MDSISEGSDNSYMASYYSSMIEKYTTVMTKIQGILPYFDECVSAINKGTDYANKIIINANPIDNGKLSIISSSVSSSKALLSAIISECNEKIAEYTVLYNSVLSNSNK